MAIGIVAMIRDAITGRMGLGGGSWVATLLACHKPYAHLILGRVRRKRGERSEGKAREGGQESGSDWNFTEILVKFLG